MTTKTVYPYGPDGSPLPPATLDASDVCQVAKARGEVKWLIPGSCLESPPPGPPEGKMTRAVDEKWVFVDAPTPEVIPGPEPERITQQSLRIALTVEYERRMLVISSAYPPSERESWPVQTEEARQLLAGGAAATPWIDAAAAARGLDRSELAQRILGKAAAYAQVSGTMTGVRQAIEDRIDAAGDEPEALAAIDVAAGWP